MSLNKRVKGDFNIQSVEEADSISIKSQNIFIQGLDSSSVINTVTIDGHLVVTGDTNTITSTDTDIQDNYITLNAGETGLGVTAGTSGFLIDRGAAPNGDAGIRFNESADIWEYNNGDGAGWQPFGTGSGGGINNVVEDSSPQLGGDLDVNGWTITSAANGDVVLQADGTGLVKIDQDLSLKEQATDETPEAGYNKLYAKTPAGGGTGLFVSNNSVVDEVVSRKKAIVYGIVF